ncbi:MAG: M23 family metallopeptidase [Longimicrobiales bacterium]
MTFSKLVTIGCVAMMLVCSASQTNAQTASDSAALLSQGRAFTQALYAGETESLYAQMAPAFQQTVGGAAGLEAFAAQIAAQLGAEAEVTLEDVASVQGVTFYTRIARFENMPAGTATVSWTWRGDTILGAGVRPTQQPAPSEFLDYEPRASLRLPFSDEFTVFWGGRLPHQNYHVVYPNQRFAYDLLIARNGSTHEGDGTRNEDYYCFGRPILAPAAGVVTVAVDTLPDNVPGEMTPAAPAGNHVIIDHGNDEYSLLGHLRSGSVLVSAGDSVASGEQIGTCGNSGNTSEPHLHYHLQNMPTFTPAAQGLPVFFNDLLVNDVPVERAEPVRGQRIRPRTP